MSETTDAEVIDTSTGEVLPAIREEPPQGWGGYMGVATLAIRDEQAKKLAEALPDEAHDILPTGEVYVPQVHYRRILNGTFGPGAWAMVPRGAFVKETKGDRSFVYREYALVVNGRFISEATGEQEYFHDSMTYATACEAVKSNALTRCCKDLGIASECWDKRWAEQWIAKYAVQVWRKKRGDKPRPPEWRRRDAQPFFDETGYVKAGEGKAEPRQEQKPEPAPAVPRNGGPDPALFRAALKDDTSEVIGLSERKYLFARAGEFGFNEARLRECVKAITGDESTAKLTKRQMETVVLYMDALAEAERKGA